MNDVEKIYVLGGGAVGLTLAACLAKEARDVVLVRTSVTNLSNNKIPVVVRRETDELKIEVETVSLSDLPEIHGLVVITAKSYANQKLAAVLWEKQFRGPIVLLQNGLKVERPFMEPPFPEIYRCVLYVTAQKVSSDEVTFRAISSCPMGIMAGTTTGLGKCVSRMGTQFFPFHAEENIQRQIWKKTVINAVFNSICPLLDVDNGLFVRDASMMELAEEIVGECIMLAKTQGVALDQIELMQQIVKISSGSSNVFISTWQDIQNGRETEIQSFNLEMARMASLTRPRIKLEKTEMLGEMVLAKSRGWGVR